jgi:hypothetical protein
MWEWSVCLCFVTSQFVGILYLIATWSLAQFVTTWSVALDVSFGPWHICPGLKWVCKLVG